MIDKFDSVRNGYNVSIGGGGSYGIPCSDEKKLKISRANKGKPNKNDNLRRWRETHGAWNKGGHLTPTQYQKIVAERRARCNKPISAYDPSTLEIVLRFECCADAARAMGVSKTNISRCARGGRPTSAGYVWRYDDESI